MAIRSGSVQFFPLLLACALLLCNVLFSIQINCSSTTNSNESELMTYNPPAIQSTQTAELINQPTTTVLHNQTFTIGICAIIKDMDAYLNEWLD